MKRYYGLFAILAVFALLSGCASISRTSGFTVRERESFGPQEPWHNLVLRENVSAVNAVAVVYVPLPQPVPQRWLDEFKHTRNGQLLQRWVFRALLYRGESFTGIFDAVLNKQRTGFFVLLPNENYTGNNLVILSSDTKWLMTTKGGVVDLIKKQSLLELPAGFFQEHPSQITQVVEMRRNNPAGKKFLADLEEMFPRRVPAHGKVYFGRGDTKYVADNFTAGDNTLDNIVSCGSLSANMAMITPIGAAITVGYATIRNTYVAINGCQ
jgi:hypothetical protein